MDIEQVRADILRWIQEFVEVPQPALGGWSPCPYARQARLKNLIDIRLGKTDPYADARNIADMAGFDVIAMIYSPTEFPSSEFNTLIDSSNPAFLQGRDLIALADHPDDREEINGVVMNQGQYAIMFVQSLSKLNTHARQLSDRGFYHGWPEEYLQVLLRGREDPRS
jgi:hypothetical protein